jgi:hypothetical protein
MHVAASKGHMAVVRTLLTARAVVNNADDHGQGLTLVHFSLNLSRF